MSVFNFINDPFQFNVYIVEALNLTIQSFSIVVSYFLTYGKEKKKIAFCSVSLYINFGEWKLSFIGFIRALLAPTLHHNRFTSVQLLCLLQLKSQSIFNFPRTIDSLSSFFWLCNDGGQANLCIAQLIQRQRVPAISHLLLSSFQIM